MRRLDQCRVAADSETVRSVLAARLFKAAGGAGLYTDLPFGRILADITVGRQHISNQYESIGRSYGAALFGMEEQKDLML